MLEKDSLRLKFKLILEFGKRGLTKIFLSRWSLPSCKRLVNAWISVILSTSGISCPCWLESWDWGFTLDLGNSSSKQLLVWLFCQTWSFQSLTKVYSNSLFKRCTCTINLCVQTMPLLCSSLYSSRRGKIIVVGATQLITYSCFLHLGLCSSLSKQFAMSL